MSSVLSITVEPELASAIIDVEIEVNRHCPTNLRLPNSDALQV